MNNKKQLDFQTIAVDFDAVNDNLPEIIEFYGHNSRKISCDYYRVFKVVEGLVS